MPRTALTLAAIALVAAAPAAQAQILAGTAINPTGTSNDAMLIDALSGAAASAFSGRAVWGATYDIAGGRILITSDGGFGGGEVFEWDPVVGGAPVQLGGITEPAGGPLRIDGLAISGGVLYGSRAGGLNDGIYEIDIDTLVATLIIPSTNSISGIDADADTGIIYGVDDTIQSLVEIDPIGGTITPVVAYPDPLETDIDGLAVGGGFAYLIPDDNDPGLIYVYDIANDTFVTPLPAPWSATPDIFSGGAYIVDPTGPVVEIPTMSTLGFATLAVLLAAAAVVFLRRRAAA